MCPALDSVPRRGAIAFESEERLKHTGGTGMQGVLFMLGTVVVEGGLVALIMWLFTAQDREAGHEEDARRRLAELEAEEQRLRRAA